MSAVCCFIVNYSTLQFAIKLKPITDILLKSCSHVPVNTNHLHNICIMLGQRRRRWADFVQMLYKCFVFSEVLTHLYIIMWMERNRCGYGVYIKHLFHLGIFCKQFILIMTKNPFTSKCMVVFNRLMFTFMYWTCFF